MKIAFNPSTVAALITPPNNKDITFDLRGRNIFARGVKFQGTDTNTWRDIKINNVSIGSNILDLRNGSNTTLTNTNGVVTINSTWRPVVDNLTSDSTTSSLSANLGRVLKSLIDGKSDSEHTHDDRYLRLTGGWMSGDINFGGDNKIYWGRNTDSASISFKNDGDGDADSYMSFVTSDNGNEYFRWSHSSGSTNTEWMALRSDGLRVGGTKVSLEGHSHNDLYYTKTEVNNKLNGKSDTSHTHDDRYLKLTGGTMTGVIKSVFESSTWINGVTNAIIKGEYTKYGAILSIPVKDGRISLSSFPANDNNIYFGYATTQQINSGTNDFNKCMYWDAPNNNLHADIFTGTLAGNAFTATKLQTARTIWGQRFDGTGDVNGTIYINNSNSSNGAIRLNNNVNSNARISAIDSQVIFNTDAAIRFGGTSWDWNVWAGLKYTHSNKTIYLGIADNSIFNANSALSGGSLRFPGISNVYATTFNGSLSGNASTATTLQTTRTLWGQSFNGSNNVSGNMSGVGLITFSALSGTNGRTLLYLQMADNDFFRIYVGGTASNSGYVEIATADDGNEPIYVRQYTGVFSSVKRTLTLLDANGYTHFPSYINIGGNENNNSSPDRVWGSNSSDSYLRSYRTSALRVAYANSAGSATKVIVNLNTANDTNYPLVWSNLNNTNTITENQLYKSWSDLYYNPKNKRLTVGGSIYAAHFYESSDKTLKKNIKSILSSTNIPKIREFDWKDTGEHSYGFIALELEELGYGCLVNEADGKKTVNYTATLALTVAKLLNLINIQNKKISNLTKELKALKYGRKKNS